MLIEKNKELLLFLFRERQNISFEKILFLRNETTEKCNDGTFCREIFTRIEVIVDLQQEEN